MCDEIRSRNTIRAQISNSNVTHINTTNIDAFPTKTVCMCTGELAFQHNNRESLKRNILAKMLVILDAKDSRLSDLTNKRECEIHMNVVWLMPTHVCMLYFTHCSCVTMQQRWHRLSANCRRCTIRSWWPRCASSTPVRCVHTQKLVMSCGLCVCVCSCIYVCLCVAFILQLRGLRP